GVKQDYNQAVFWYRKAAEQGHVGAEYSLGVMYENGEGVKPNYNEAVKWYRKAADKEDEDAKEALKRIKDK
ncbi:MAG: sel1 repeat family protein, partial [Muribaculaceae bacterium]|nr:sel1 repeat family protein [Muribaculaceae bacterium]